jgi:hypothetical protein
MSSFRPARYYLLAAIVAFGLAAFSAWSGWNWTPAFIPAVLFLLSAGLLLFLATRPAITVREKSCTIGKRSFLWADVERLDTARWGALLVVKITLRGAAPVRLIHAGDEQTNERLLRHMRRLARGARIDGVPYRQYWGQQPTAVDDDLAASRPRYRMLRPEDEEEVERLYQRLRSGGSAEQQTSSEERHE